MTNGEKYKTAQERAAAFNNFCRDKDCDNCKAASKNQTRVNKLCHWTWLDLKAEDEKPLPCPFCGKEVVSITTGRDKHKLVCECGYCSPTFNGIYHYEESIAAHNRVAKAVKRMGETNGNR